MYSHKNITTQTTTTILERGGGVLGGVCINKPVATGVIAVWDGDASTGTLIGTITTQASPQNKPDVLTDISLNNGLTIITSVASQDITIKYKP